MDGQLQDPIKVGLQERPAGTAVQGPCQHKIAAQYNISGVSYEVYTEDWPQDSIKPGLQEGPQAQCTRPMSARVSTGSRHGVDTEIGVHSSGSAC